MASFYSIKNALYSKLHLNKYYQEEGESQVMVNDTNEDNKILGFLLGLGAGAIIYAFLSLFQKENHKSSCPVCHVDIDKGVLKCPNCDSKFRWK